MIIDDFIKEEHPTSEMNVKINGKICQGWQITKPLNKTSFLKRVIDAIKVIKGKGIVLQYFEDLSEKEKTTYVLKKLREEHLR